MDSIRSSQEFSLEIIFQLRFFSNKKKKDIKSTFGDSFMRFLHYKGNCMLTFSDFNFALFFLLMHPLQARLRPEESNDKLIFVFHD